MICDPVVVVRPGGQAMAMKHDKKIILNTQHILQ